MKEIILLLCSIALTQAFKIQIDQVSLQTEKSKGSVKIPGFIGLGYHALKGNPYTNKVDEGFRSPVFTFTYDKGLTTQDGLFQIPDFTYSTQTIACTMQSKTSTFSGTENYQKQLSNTVAFDSSFDMLVMSAKFSFSVAFQTFSNSTISKNQTTSTSNAQCTIYTLQMPLYSNELKLNNDFIEGVKQAYSTNNWQTFIEHFGTHYATTVTYGGRYFLEHTYTAESISLFRSMKLDLHIAAQVQFFLKSGMSLSDDLKRYENQTKVISSKVETERLSTVGGLPPASGNWIDWVNSVKANLAPISYKMTGIVVLFNHIEGINKQAVMSSFLTFFNNYCAKHVCPPMIPDRPDPNPLSISFLQLPQIKGQSVSSHTYTTDDRHVTVAMRIYKVMMGAAGNIDSIQFFLTDGITQHATQKVGAQVLNKQYQVPAGDEIKCIRFGIHQNGTYWRFASMQYVTRKGAQSQQYKGTFVVNQYQVSCTQNNNQHIVGFYGRYNVTFDSIGLILMKEFMPA